MLRRPNLPLLRLSAVITDFKLPKGLFYSIRECTRLGRKQKHGPLKPLLHHLAPQTRPVVENPPTWRQNGIKGVGAKIAEIGDGEGAGLELIGRQLLGACALHQVCPVAANLQDTTPRFVQYRA